MFEIREEKRFKGWYRIWIKLSNGEYLMSKRRYSSFEKAQKEVEKCKSN